MENYPPYASYPAGSSRPGAPSGGRWQGLLAVMILLVLVLVAPYLAEQIEFAMTRGKLRAKAEAAAAELGDLAKNAELVKLSDTSRAFRNVAQLISPSVVHIDTEQIERVRSRSIFDEFGGEGSHDKLYRAIGQGSGIIIDKAGYILTNNHVIENARTIVVKLADGREISDVKVVGYDVYTDLAVLKIRAPDLIAASWGSSDDLEVGDWVLAVGNPYGLDRTVTSGILSAKERHAIDENNAYQDFLQTDAAVNPGNSGGPLLNIQGEVVGITTAIVGRAYQGISFAIPSHIAQNVYTHLIENGKVPRGYLGVGLQELTPDLAQKLSIPDTNGVLITGVQKGSPAEKAGLEAGDVVTEWAGKKVDEPAELRLQVAGTAIGAHVTVKIIRNGKPTTLQVDVGEREG
ncbi:MAG TPA: trypsin-like peptidase domain-containing protein [Pirellulales bacterium]|jgi:Do/DeqQ family serine protease|nr:trypsin-like peptidase domain-containing protein [Pirellulales bacterium]